ncbi:uncharacterized protein B0T15DRAFT_403550 [Chaetomium strumarium]|uniref:Protein kinase domain-containing protein n=1 Tax=Chaetomium strumarium TaxID=1170767 RepID=A0AAJ0LYV9_9PEZI|nr:hypothetical protein B0T15DRAFT_403550 [Chaetomium strumarium]
MDSFIPMGGVQLPSVGRRLSRLYNDTKKSSDFVKEPVHHAIAEADPEIKSLHRKLRIQKDRLVSWGLEWSDPSNQSAEVLIDSSLSKAGLSEVVGSIMSTIKDILAEAEPLWNSSRRLAGEREEPPKRGEKIRMVVWDKNRFEDLIRDLTTSIDTLYDLSRTRSSYAQPSAAVRERLSRPSPAAEDLRPFESSRIQTPKQIDPASLTNLRSMQAEPMTERAEQERREIVFMSRQAYAELTQTAGGRQPHAPLLLEYATFDSIYSMTGISPPMTRFEKLSAGLQSEPQRSPGSWTGLPRLLGYFEDFQNSRFGLVYQFPRMFNPVTYEHLTQNPLYNLCSLADLLARPDFEPTLEAKYRLAANLANTVFDMHARGITHGNLVSENISFCNAVGTDPEVSGITQGEVDIRRPLISSFDLFSDPQLQEAPRPFSLYKHPLDPRNSVHSPLANNADSKTFDLYSLAMILLSIGLWTKLENLVPSMESPTLPESILKQLANRCTTLYAKAVETCWNAVDQEMSGAHTTEEVVYRVQFKASRYLEACCILDSVSALEERLRDDLGEPRPAPQPTTTAGPSEGSQPEQSEAATAVPARSQSMRSDLVSPATPSQEADASAKPSKKMRLYPHIPLSPEIVEKWDTVFMPQINSALRHFYRKNPESVEISLESIGESPHKTRPTVLVVCTSVQKVKAILKKKLGNNLFDGTAGVGLKVCQGRVLRSRKEPASRSMAKSADDGREEVVAANPDYQERPKNGASIGAWIGDRHLPPVSLGGLIMVDDRQYGMTVHHMLDDPDQVVAAGNEGAPRSMARGVPDLAAWYAQQQQQSESDPDSSGTEDYACEFTDSDSDTLSESAITSDYSEEEEEEDEDEQYTEPGDIPGIEPGCGDGYIITQPALDDVPDGFYPSAETQDEDHLDTYTVGEVYASSGIRRRTENGLLHEIDWALFEFSEDRLPEGNLIPHVGPSSASFKSRRFSWEDRHNSDTADEEATVIHPTSVVPSSSLAGLEVQCMARTSGFQTGLILPAVASVKIYGRTSPSQIYQVSGITTQSPHTHTHTHPSPNSKRTYNLPMGIPGDSGAWVVDREEGAVCGHILAWSERKRVAYICPMDVLLLDIAETLEASEIRLPGGEVIFSRRQPFTTGPNIATMGGKMGVARTSTQSTARTARTSRFSTTTTTRHNDGDDDEAPGLVSELMKRRRSSTRRSQLTQRGSYRGSRNMAAAAEKDEDGDGSCDEAVEVELPQELKELQLSERDVSMGRRRWGFA